MFRPAALPVAVGAGGTVGVVVLLPIDDGTRVVSVAVEMTEEMDDSTEETTEETEEEMEEETEAAEELALGAAVV